MFYGELKSAENNLKEIEKHMRLLSSKNSDVNEERKVYAALIPFFRDVIRSLLWVIRSKWGMALGKSTSAAFDAVHRRADDLNKWHDSGKDSIYSGIKDT